MIGYLICLTQLFKRIVETHGHGIKHQSNDGETFIPWLKQKKKKKEPFRLMFELGSVDADG